jgi:glycosyltransferase involved in cell wall biosynthesis
MSEKRMNSAVSDGMGGYDLDIIVPAYNVEKYVKQCVESILNQTTKYKFRCILIDDGSPDNTGTILDEYKNDERVVVIHQANKGFSGARNTGIRMLESRYVMFVDSDDYLLNGAVEELMKEAFDKSADIVQGGYNSCNSKGTVYSCYMSKNGKLSINDMKGFPWGKVFRSTLFEHVGFPEKYWYEDSLMRQIIYPMCSRMYGVSQPVYVYRNNPEGVSHSGVKNPKCLDSLYITMKLFEDRKKLNIKIDDDYYEYIMKMAKFNASRARYMPKNIQKDAFYVYANFVKKNFGTFYSKKNHDMEYALDNGCFELYKIYARLK